MTASTKRNKIPFLLGVAGGSGSGKTYFAQALQKALGESYCGIISQDNFYIDQSNRFDHDGGSVNFDHPSSIDFSLLAEKLRGLKTGSAVDIPVYDFVTHTRAKHTFKVEPLPVLIVDGILIFHPEEVRSLFDETVFFDTPEELRFQRRLTRDVQERGRTPEGVRSQFFKQVKPMHDLYVEPSKSRAGVVVRDLGDFDGALADFKAKLRALTSG